MVSKTTVTTREEFTWSSIRLDFKLFQNPPCLYEEEALSPVAGFLLEQKDIEVPLHYALSISATIFLISTPAQKEGSTWKRWMPPTPGMMFQSCYSFTPLEVNRNVCCWFYVVFSTVLWECPSSMATCLCSWHSDTAAHLWIINLIMLRGSALLDETLLNFYVLYISMHTHTHTQNHVILSL